MTFTEWINTQEDICSKLREQGYEEKNDIRKFFNDRINERKWFFPELFKEDDEEDNTEAEEKEKN